jgi:hypothetical protein
MDIWITSVLPTHRDRSVNVTPSGRIYRRRIKSHRRALDVQVPSRHKGRSSASPCCLRWLAPVLRAGTTVRGVAALLRRPPGRKSLTRRLLLHKRVPAISQFIKRIDEGTPRPRLRPLRPTLAPAGGPARRVLEGPTRDSGSKSAIFTVCKNQPSDFNVLGVAPTPRFSDNLVGWSD